MKPPRVGHAFAHGSVWYFESAALDIFVCLFVFMPMGRWVGSQTNSKGSFMVSLGVGLGLCSKD